MTVRNLRCYIYGHDNSWEGICTDLDVAVHATSLAAARSALDSAVRAYIESAMNEDSRTANRLLSRKAPLLVRLKLRFATWRYSRRLARNQREQYADFVLPCHA